jgi:hypothetical protein
VIGRRPNTAARAKALRAAGARARHAGEANSFGVRRCDVKPGGRVLLQWNGYPGVTQTLSCTWATVTECLRSRFVVESQEGTRTVRLDQIREVQ